MVLSVKGRAMKYGGYPLPFNPCSPSYKEACPPPLHQDNPDYAIGSSNIQNTTGRFVCNLLFLYVVLFKNSTTYFVNIPFWRERAAFQRSAFGRSTASNDVVATIFIRLFLFFPVFLFFFFSLFFFSVVTFSHRRSARIKKLI